MSEAELEAIEKRNQARTPGSWYWWGNTDGGNVELCSRVDSFTTVMMFRRWKVQRAKPMFRDINQETGKMYYSLEGVEKFVKYQVHYRKDFGEIQHPDAIFIANAPQDMTDLLTEVKRLRKIETAAWKYFEAVENDDYLNKLCGYPFEESILLAQAFYPEK